MQRRLQQFGRIADGVLSAFARVYAFDESQAPRMMHIFRNALLTLVEIPDATLLSAQRVLVDASYPKTAIGSVRNPVDREFWLNEFAKVGDKIQDGGHRISTKQAGSFSHERETPAHSWLARQPHRPATHH